MLPVSRSSNGTPLFSCICPSCGAERIQDRRKIGKKCLKCMLVERNLRHGQSKTKLYRVWTGMKTRCTNEKSDNYEYYGGRGISVHPEWAGSFDTFKAWADANGYADGLELDRHDNDGDYTPDNCKFITHQLNSQKRGNAKCTLEKAIQIKALIANGEQVKDIAVMVGVKYMCVWHISNGNTWLNA